MIIKELVEYVRWVGKTTFCSPVDELFRGILQMKKILKATQTYDFVIQYI